MLVRIRGLATVAVMASSIVCCTAQADIRQPGNCTVKDAATRPDCGRAIAFFRKFFDAFQAGRRGQVADMVQYPLRISLGGKRVLISSRSDLLAKYDNVFDAGVRCAIRQASPTDVWGRDQGFTFNDGAIWWDAAVPKGASVPQSPEGWARVPMKIIAVNTGMPQRGCGAAKE